MPNPNASLATVCSSMNPAPRASAVLTSMLRKGLVEGPEMRILMLCWSKWANKRNVDDLLIENQIQVDSLSNTETSALNHADDKKERKATFKEEAAESGHQECIERKRSPRKSEDNTDEGTDEDSTDEDSTLQSYEGFDIEDDNSFRQESSSRSEQSSKFVPSMPATSLQANRAFDVNISKVSKEHQLHLDLLTEEVVDAFFDNGASCELMASWAKIESEIWSANSPYVAIPTPVRSVTLKFMRCVAKDLKFQPEAWYEMVIMLDRYLHRASSVGLLEALPLVSGVIIRLVAKLNSQYAHHCSELDGLLYTEVPKLVSWLVSHSYIASPPTFTDKQFDDTEKEVLAVLEWRLTLPTVLTWSRSFVVRFSMLTQQRYKASLHWLWVHMTTQLDWFVQEGIAPHLSPQQLAMGLFALGLTSANLIPINVIFSETHDDTRHTFLSCQQEGAAILEDTSQEAVKLACQLLEISTAVSMLSLRQHCHDIVKIAASLGKRPQINSL